MSTPNTVAIALYRDLHRRIKRLFGAMLVANEEPPSLVGFTNRAVRELLAKEERKYGM